ncbi:DUF4422 domain-containing protein [Collinsella provencensis]|uniref:DUF4422 domain-containing protein n=1 Tax=Collinsella provencensis TaxID=1937461 RepID=UPI00131D0889|nr:DUF4422 domain-containing protein [Collinsella provencensis]
MPRFSICIPTYNNAAYLPSCLKSVLDQDYKDLEVIVINDGSTDGTSGVLSEFTARDQRVVVVDRDENLGLHLTRREAVEHAVGEYVVFLDSDDEFIPGFLSKLNVALDENPVDLLHFGIEVVDCGVGEREARDFEKFVNALVEPLSCDQITHAVFSSSTGGYRQDWRVTQRAISTPLLKRAFDVMTVSDLGRAEDAYESFVILAMADHAVTRNDIIGLRYCYGRGVNSGDPLTPEQFSEDAAEFWSSILAIDAFAETQNSSSLIECALGARHKLFDLLFNDWLYRVSDNEKVDAANFAAEVSSRLECAVQLMRLVRDKAYGLWERGDILSEDEPLLSWFDAAQQLAGNEGACSNRFQEFFHAAKDHIDDLRRQSRIAEYEKQDIRIFVSTHKRVDLFDSLILQPVQVGCALRDYRYDWALHDDEGENISTLNAMYCELTTQYWAWKNVDAPYVGFCHYRRYFDFSPEKHMENSFGEIMDGRIDSVTQSKYHLDDDSIRVALAGADIVTTVVQDIRSYMGPLATLRSQYGAADHLHVEDLDRVIDILKKNHPEYSEDADRFLSGHNACFCNMFVMRREIFNEYCEWLFPLLREFVDTTDMSRYSREGVRTPGHLSERLLNIFLLHQQRVHPEWNVKRLQCVHFEHPDFNPGLKIPIRSNDVRPIIPVVFASDDNYVPMLTTTIYSMLKNASSKYYFDVIVLTRDISAVNQRIMREFVHGFENARLSFCNVSQIIERYQLTTNNPHISVETYYRFLIQDLLPHYDKVLYLDSDLIVEGNVSELFKIDLGDNLLAATHDVDFVANVNLKRGDRFSYAKKILGMEDPYSYFQAGVLVLNTRAMRSECSMEQWLEFASDDRFIYNDQDVLNAHCEGRVIYLDYDWNVMIDCGGRIGNLFPFAPASMFDAFMDSRNHEKIVHYAGCEKPWKQSNCDRSELYWRYARETPFYERLLVQLTSGVPVSRSTGRFSNEPLISPNSRIRRFIDPIAPLGSARRDFAKKVVRKIRG